MYLILKVPLKKINGLKILFRVRIYALVVLHNGTKMRNKSSYGSIYFAKNAKTRIVIRKINNVLDEAIFVQYFQVLKAERRRL